jgi:hypothetical protein
MFGHKVSRRNLRRVYTHFKNLSRISIHNRTHPSTPPTFFQAPRFPIRRLNSLAADTYMECGAAAPLLTNESPPPKSSVRPTHPTKF